MYNQCLIFFIFFDNDPKILLQMLKIIIARTYLVHKGKLHEYSQN